MFDFIKSNIFLIKTIALELMMKLVLTIKSKKALYENS